MPAPFFAQSVVILFERAPDPQTLAAALSTFEIARVFEPEPHAAWMGGHPGLLLAHRPDRNGYALVDVIDAPWPDDMGDPKGDVALFGAWSMGWLGPHVFPDNLARALRQPTELADASEVVGRHRAFVRVQLSYVLGASGDSPIAPPDRDHLAELDFVTAVGRALLNVPGALAWFDANGEVLHSLESLESSIAFYGEHAQPPLDLWTHVRMIDPQLPERWFLMDTIGLEQLGVIDMEACIPPALEDLSAVVRFLRGAANYLVTTRAVIDDGNTIDGPGGLWRGFAFDESLAPRPRSVLRWYQVEGPRPPAVFGFGDR